MSCLFSSHASASDCSSSCWLYGGIVGGNANLPGIGIEFSPLSWPDPQTALMAFAQIALQRLQNADYDCYVQLEPNFFILKGIVSHPKIKEFQRLASMAGASALWDVPKDKNMKRRWDLRHFHVRLMGQEGLQCP